MSWGAPSTFEPEIARLRAAMARKIFWRGTMFGGAAVAAVFQITESFDAVRRYSLNFAFHDFVEYLTWYAYIDLIFFGFALVPAMAAGWVLARYVRRHGVLPHWLVGVVAAALMPMLLIMGAGVVITVVRGAFDFTFSQRDFHAMIKMSAAGILLAVMARVFVQSRDMIHRYFSAKK